MGQNFDEKFMKNLVINLYRIFSIMKIYIIYVCILFLLFVLSVKCPKKLMEQADFLHVVRIFEN